MIKRVLSIIDDEVVSSEARFNTQRQTVGGEDDSLLDNAREELWISRSVIPLHVIDSLLASLFAMFEDEMVTVCELVGSKAGGTKDFASFKDGIGIEKARKYLHEHFQIEINKYDIWPQIKSIKDLRNMIMHNNGRFEKRNPRAAESLERYIESSEWLSLSCARHQLLIPKSERIG